MNYAFKPVIDGLRNTQEQGIAARQQGERELRPNTTRDTLASAVVSRENTERAGGPESINSPDPIQEECQSCGKLHTPTYELSASTKYCGDIYFCSDRCFDDWIQFGRYERPEE